MITLQTRLHVDNMRGREVIDYLSNRTDQSYRDWWPGTHLELHTIAGPPGQVGSVIHMDEFVGRYRLRMKGVVSAIEPGRKIVWQFKMGIRLPAWLILELADDAAGVTITHTIKAGFAGPSRLLDPIFRLYLSDPFAQALDAHVRTEFPMLRDLLRRSGPLAA